MCEKYTKFGALFPLEKVFEYVYNIIYGIKNRKLGYEKKLTIKRENFHISVEERKFKQNIFGRRF